MLKAISQNIAMLFLQQIYQLAKNLNPTKLAMQQICFFQLPCNLYFCNESAIKDFTALFVKIITSVY